MTKSARGPMKDGIRRQGAGTWELKIDLPRGPDGKRRMRFVTFKGNRTAAKKERARLITEAEDGTLSNPGKATVADQLRAWRDGPARMRGAPKTYERWAEIIDGHLIPALGAVRLRDLGAAAIEEYFADALASGRRDGKGGLAWRTVWHHRTVLSMAIKSGVPALLPRNVVSDAKLPRPDSASAENDDFEDAGDLQILDDASVATLLRAVAGTRLGGPVIVAVTTGMRRGEILGLRWRDVDLDGAVLNVRTSLEQTNSGLRLKAPKTKSGRRAITLPAVTIEALREHRRAQLEERLALGIGGRSEMVFTRHDGELVDPKIFSSAFRRAAKAAGVDVTFHALRHTHASTLIRAGVSIATVSKRLGHSKISITLDVYTHVLPVEQDRAAAIMDAALGNL